MLGNTTHLRRHHRHRHRQGFRSYRGMTGATEKFCWAEDIACQSVIIHPNDHAGYYPGATQMSPQAGFLARHRQAARGAGNRLRAAWTSASTSSPRPSWASMTVDDLTEIEHAYAPPYSSAKDPVNMAGFVAQNMLDGLVKSHHLGRAATPLARAQHCSCSTCAPLTEFASGTIAGAINIPLADLRERLDELPPRTHRHHLLPSGRARLPRRAHPHGQRFRQLRSIFPAAT